MKKYYLHIIVMVGYFLFVAGSCGEEPEIVGCTDVSACNYNIEANVNNGTCIFSEENFDCNGNCITQTDDGCECAVLYDECGFCGGDNSSCTDCNGDLEGSAFIDGCEICVGGNTEMESCPSDCLGIDGGSAWINPCDLCVPENDSTCKQGCDGNWVNDGSEILIDDCEICNGDNSPNTGVCDCNGIPNGLSFFDECGNCISNEISWKMQVKASILPFNNSELDIVYDEENYLGGAPNATDGFDGIIIDKIDALIHSPGNWIDFFFYHDDWSNATAASCEDFCTKFKEDIRGNSHSEYMDGNTKIWKGFLEYSIYGMATLTLSSTSNIIDADISISIGTDNFLPISINESIDIPIYPNEPPKVIHIQISNLCY